MLGESGQSAQLIVITGKETGEWVWSPESYWWDGRLPVGVDGEES